MKKVLFALIALFTFAFSSSLFVEVDAAEGEKVVVHYYKFAGDYDGVGLWTWDNGTDDSHNKAFAKSGMDDAGWAMVEFPVDKATMSTEGKFLPFGFGVTQGESGWPAQGDAAKDSKNQKDVIYDREAFKASTENELHVYFVQGQDAAYMSREAAMIAAGLAVEDSENPGQIDSDFVVLTIIYYDATQEYKGWNIWTFGNGVGASVDGVDFQYTVNYVLNGIASNHKVAFININKATTEETGFILRTDSWDKKFPDDIMFDNSAVIANGGGVAYYLAGEGMLRTGVLADFLTDAYAFKATEAKAVSQTQIQLEMNKEIVTVKVDEAGVKTVVFDKAWITLTDKDGNAVAIEDVLYNSVVESTKSFSIVLAEASKLNPAKAPYTVSFAYESETADKVVAYDTVAPTFTLLVDKNQRVEVGSTWALGLYTATDDVDGILTPFVSATGIVDTSKLGNYTVTLSVKDSLGNVGTEVLTVTVYDPCDEETASASLWLGFISAPLAVAAIFARRYFI
ncbi:MAG TPA: pullulanase-associated domain-containing protein [Acholeplasma sp.]|nr:pullulanase-associated domain-containing protein [Acholeplasma sp.]